MTPTRTDTNEPATPSLGSATAMTPQQAKRFWGHLLDMQIEQAGTPADWVVGRVYLPCNVTPNEGEMTPHEEAIFTGALNHTMLQVEGLVEAKEAILEPEMSSTQRVSLALSLVERALHLVTTARNMRRPENTAALPDVVEQLETARDGLQVEMGLPLEESEVEQPWVPAIGDKVRMKISTDPRRVGHIISMTPQMCLVHFPRIDDEQDTWQKWLLPRDLEFISR